MRNRRRSPRIAYLTAARLENTSGTWEGAVRDLSADGMFLETSRQFEVGERLDVLFHMRHSRQKIDMAAEIRHVAPEGIGVQILW